MSAPDEKLAQFIQANGLAERGEQGAWVPLAGGVSSDIWRVETQRRTFCVKRALAQLKVAADWRADVGRSAAEFAFMQFAAQIAPGSVPAPLAQDSTGSLFAMSWLDTNNHRLWKTELLAGRVDVGFAGELGDLLGRIHAASARDPSVPRRFATDQNFHALRIDPYLIVVARAHSVAADRLRFVADRTARTKQVLVHGDVSPKNILIGPSGPVLLDAEVAWFGDPAFDLAFCLNHLVIKARITGPARADLIASFDLFAARYLSRVDWEPGSSVEARAADLLPCLALARVDGKSPLEYLTEAQRVSLREAALGAISTQPATLREAREALLTS